MLPVSVYYLMYIASLIAVMYGFLNNPLISIAGMVTLFLTVYFFLKRKSQKKN